MEEARSSSSPSARNTADRPMRRFRYCLIHLRNRATILWNRIKSVARMKEMKFLLVVCVITVVFATSANSNPAIPFYLGTEPLIRIGLSTNASSISITTGDSSLVAYSPDEQLRMLGSNRVSVAARAYRPPRTRPFGCSYRTRRSSRSVPRRTWEPS